MLHECCWSCGACGFFHVNGVGTAKCYYDAGDGEMENYCGACGGARNYETWNDVYSDLGGA